MTEATFHLATDGERFTARAGSAYVGRSVRYGRLGRVGEVTRAVPVDGGRALRLHVGLTRKLINPDRRKFRLAPATTAEPSEETSE